MLEVANSSLHFSTSNFRVARSVDGILQFFAWQDMGFAIR
jgi:hypothetical protein